MVGRLYDDPPEFYCAVVVDGVRFRADVDLVTCGYQRRRPEEVPAEWLDRITTRTWRPRKVGFHTDRSAVADPPGDLVASNMVAPPGTAIDHPTNSLPPLLECPSDTQVK